MIDTGSTEQFLLDIDALSYGPYGVGRREGRVLLVPLTAPGDRIEATPIADKGNYMVGRMMRLVHPSPLRQSPPCPYFAECGGCPWQHIKYEAQLAAKAKSVEDALRRIGKLTDFELLPILSSPREYAYRSRVRLHIARDRRVGFHRAFSREMIEIDECRIAAEPISPKLQAARMWAKELKTAVNELEMVTGNQEGQMILVGKAEGAFASDDDATCAHFLEQHGEITGLILFGNGWRRAWGDTKILIDHLDGKTMMVDADLFTQVNRSGNRQMVEELLSVGEFHAHDRILELYCGAGNFTLPLARRCRQIVAVEGNVRSVENGKINGQLQALENIRWIRSHVPKTVTRLKDQRETFTKIVLNPPRSGAKGIEADLALLGAEKILYVSCNPATLARDLSAFTKQGFKLNRVRPVDFFPHTFHVEVLAEMVR